MVSNIRGDKKMIGRSRFRNPEKLSKISMDTEQSQKQSSRTSISFQGSSKHAVHPKDSNQIHLSSIGDLTFRCKTTGYSTVIPNLLAAAHGVAT